MATPYMVFVVDVSASINFNLPLENFTGTIDWGDGSSNSYSNQNNPSHTFTLAGTYNISITSVSKLTSIGYNSSTIYKDCLKGFSYNTKIHSLTNLGYAFANCDNLETAYFAPNVTNNVTNMSSMFYSNFGNILNSPIELDCASCTNLYALFEGCQMLDSSVNLYNTYNVTDMSRMFFMNTSFNKPVTLDCSSCTTLNGMFIFCYAFNSPVTLTNTGNVQNMALMFYSAVSFNQPLNFDCSSCTTMSQMLQVTSFNSALNLTPIPNLGDASQNLSGCPLSPQNYSDLLNLWASNAPNLQSNVDLGAHFIKYNSSAIASRQLLVNDYSWNIIDAGLYVPPAPTITSIDPNLFPITGGTATIIGTDFNNNLSVSLMYYDTFVQYLGVSSFTDTSIECTILQQGQIADLIGYSVKVTTDSGNDSIPISYHSNVVISSISLVNNTLSIYGDGFDGYITNVLIDSSSVPYTTVSVTNMIVPIDSEIFSPNTYTLYINSQFGDPSMSFIYNYPPTITYVTPINIPAGTNATIDGYNFINNNLQVYISEETEIPHTYVNNSQIIATIPPETIPGEYTIYVINAFGYSFSSINVDPASSIIVNPTTLTNFLNNPAETEGFIGDHIQISEIMVNTTNVNKKLINTGSYYIFKI